MIAGSIAASPSYDELERVMMSQCKSVACWSKDSDEIDWTRACNSQKRVMVRSRQRYLRPFDHSSNVMAPIALA